MADPYTSVSITSYNANPPSDDGSATETNRVKWSTIKTKLADTIKTALESINTNLVTAFGKIDGGITSTAISYQVLAADQGKLVRASASGITITTPDAASVGAPFVFGFLNDSSGTITLDGSGSQTIDGDTTVTVPAGNGGRLRTDGSNWFTEGQNFQPSLAQAQGLLSGLTLSTAGSSATFAVAAGIANDVSSGGIMTLAASISKTTSAWAVGTGNGALDTGTIANSTWYHVYLIKRVDTGVVDALVSTSASAPTMPTNYTLKRRIGSMKTNGSGQWTKFTQLGDTFLWEVPVVISASTYGTGSRSTLTLTVPTGLSVNALFKVSYNGTGGGNGAYITSLLAETDTTTHQDISSGGYDSQNFKRITNTSAQIGLRPTNAADLFTLSTYGWEDTRGK